jgi:hypothetical protein
MARALRRILSLASFLVAAATVWALAQNPLVLPFAQRGAAEARAALEAAVAQRVDADWLLPRLERALAAGDADRAETLIGLADRHGVTVPQPLAQDVAALVSPPRGERLAQCGRCAFDPANCRSVRFLASCALPVELTPIGDVNALRRQAAARVAGEEVDTLETGLALAGLGATALIPVSGGTSSTIKAGTGIARLAYRSGRLTPEFSGALAEAAAAPVAWDRAGDLMTGRAVPGDVVDTARIADLGRLGGDLGRLAGNTTLPDTLALLRHVKGPEDLSRLARLSDIAGESTRPAVEALGPARAFRATTRVSDLVLGAAALIAALAVQLAGLATALALGTVRRALPRG